MPADRDHPKPPRSALLLALALQLLLTGPAPGQSLFGQSDPGGRDGGQGVRETSETGDAVAAVPGGGELRPLRILPVEGGRVFSLDYAPDGATLAVADTGRAVYLFRPEEGREVWAKGYDESLPEAYVVCFTPDGEGILVGGSSGDMALLDHARGEVREEGRARGQVWGMAVSEDGHLAVALDSRGTLSRWDLGPDEGRRSRGLLGTTLDWATGRDRVETVLDLGPKTHSDVVLSADGSTAWAATGGFGTLVGAVLGSEPPTPTIHEVDLRTGRVRRRLLGHTAAIRTLALAPDGRTLASGGWDGTLRLWDLASGEDRVLARYQEDVNGVAWSPDGAVLVAAIDNGNVSVVDAGTGATLTVAGHEEYTSHVAVSPDGERFASGGSGDVLVWDLGAFRARLAGGQSD